VDEIKLTLGRFSTMLSKKKKKGDICAVCTLQYKNPSQARIQWQETLVQLESGRRSKQGLNLTSIKKVHCSSDSTETTATRYNNQPTAGDASATSKRTRKEEMI